jgi:hypothetical protein
MVTATMGYKMRAFYEGEIGYSYCLSGVERSQQTAHTKRISKLKLDGEVVALLVVGRSEQSSLAEIR